MPEKVFILAKVDATHLDSIIAALEANDAVRHVHVVTGAYDILVCMEGDNLARLLSRALREVSSLEGVKSTETLVSIDLD